MKSIEGGGKISVEKEKKGAPCAGPAAELWDSTREVAAHRGASCPLLLSRLGLQSPCGRTAEKARD